MEEQSIISEKNIKNQRNQGVPLELDWIKNITANKNAIENRTSTLAGRRSIKKQWQVAWLLKAITCMDLTTLAGDDTEGRVYRLCHKAKNPINNSILEGFKIDDLNITVGAVCVYHSMIKYAKKIVSSVNIPVAAVSTGFPAGQISHSIKLQEIKNSVSEGADEIDVVISREKVIKGDWEGLYSEIASFREACGSAHIKVILATGQLPTYRDIAKASMISMMAGADFIKTSTGMESINATLPVGLVMVRSIKEYYMQTGYKVGFKPAGGIRTAKDALLWLTLMKEELGNSWTSSTLFRFGASGLLADIERQLEHNLTGKYSAYYRHPLG
jgi:deoxyribose-phosphate aldolase